MAVKGRHRRRSTKSTLRHSGRRRSTRSRRHTRRNRTHRNRRYCMRGGNYETDVTTRTLEGTPTKPLNKIVVALPGHGTMSGTAYVRLMEDIDRNGSDIYK
jgi:hypothetical protein